ncbi:hypothetical protein MBM_05654 [Drepanopeziza brunnea f. sp. 'multigermtubi' MB_m1]|uniref:Uncharacterized protein n=2 Tax=Drepanopeziza brunnea f. sp. 'multigermtubi' TaxID=698441 RepID=K1WFT8_MARBU|nr:uncharacterized protein MBM_05654 [Drepanopeziza brunnea f. sp. 'multigermtubi' MB_m1]EKD16360.1 hypothetical protein MBM_05654 [Drepanopeziza brunnea f. sp. 'multigermtubi' MB_m1]
MSWMLAKARTTARTHPAASAGEAVSEFQLWLAVEDNHIRVAKERPGAPRHIQQYLAERRTFGDFWGPENVHLFPGPPPDHSSSASNPRKASALLQKSPVRTRSVYTQREDAYRGRSRSPNHFRSADRSRSPGPSRSRAREQSRRRDFKSPPTVSRALTRGTSRYIPFRDRIDSSGTSWRMRAEAMSVGPQTTAQAARSGGISTHVPALQSTSPPTPHHDPRTGKIYPVLKFSHPQAYTRLSGPQGQAIAEMSRYFHALVIRLEKPTLQSGLGIPSSAVLWLRVKISANPKDDGVQRQIDGCQRGFEAYHKLDQEGKELPGILDFYTANRHIFHHKGSLRRADTIKDMTLRNKALSRPT